MKATPIKKKRTREPLVKAAMPEAEGQEDEQEQEEEETDPAQEGEPEQEQDGEQDEMEKGCAEMGAGDVPEPESTNIEDQTGGDSIAYDGAPASGDPTGSRINLGEDADLEASSEAMKKGLLGWLKKAEDEENADAAAQEEAASQLEAAADEEMEKSYAELLEKSMGSELFQKGQIYIGPHGGKWADAKHTIPYSEKKHGGGKPEPKAKPADEHHAENITQVSHHNARKLAPADYHRAGPEAQGEHHLALQKHAIHTALANKMASGNYDHAHATKLFAYHAKAVDMHMQKHAGAKKASAATRMHAAKQFADHFVEQVKSGEHHDKLNKKNKRAVEQHRASNPNNDGSAKDSVSMGTIYTAGEAAKAKAAKKAAATQATPKKDAPAAPQEAKEMGYDPTSGKMLPISNTDKTVGVNHGRVTPAMPRGPLPDHLKPPADHETLEHFDKKRAPAVAAHEKEQAAKKGGIHPAVQAAHDKVKAIDTSKNGFNTDDADDHAKAFEALHEAVKEHHGGANAQRGSHEAETFSHSLDAKRRADMGRSSAKARDSMAHASSRAHFAEAKQHAAKLLSKLGGMKKSNNRGDDMTAFQKNGLTAWMKSNIPGAEDTSEGLEPNDMPEGVPSDVDQGKEVNGPMLAVGGMNAGNKGAGSSPGQKGLDLSTATGKQEKLNDDDPDADSMQSGAPYITAGVPETSGNIGQGDAKLSKSTGVLLSREEMTAGARYAAGARLSAQTPDVVTGVGRAAPAQQRSQAVTEPMSKSDADVEAVLRGDGLFAGHTPTLLDARGMLQKSVGCPACHTGIPAWTSRCPECGVDLSGPTLQKSIRVESNQPQVRSPGVRPRVTADLVLPGGVRLPK